jgi:hypothetical protein
MSAIKKSFNTKYSAVEMKNYISTNLLPNPALSSLLEHTNWEDNNLFIKSKLGSGYIMLFDNRVDIDIQLSIFGSLTKKGLEAALDKEFKQLNAKN